ncbi:MAG TPA: phospholipase D-like domain-containing protein [Thermomicrobiales bacterium]|nr:phospholipase D-like domain-containing protein [Thermomicrobiales bacterium]
MSITTNMQRKSGSGEDSGARSRRVRAARTRARRSGFDWRLKLIIGVLFVALAIFGWVSASNLFPPLPWNRIPPTATPAPGGSVALFVEPEDGIGPVLDEITGAKQSVDVEVYILSDERIISALEQAAKRGVAVRVMLEEHPFGGPGTEKQVKARLDAAGVETNWSNPVFRFSHIKMIIIDNRTALILSLNLSRSAFTGNRDFGAITSRAAEVTQARAIFTADWTRTEAPDGPLVVSPTDSRAQLLAMIDHAQHTLDVYAEVMRDREIIDALKRAAGRGVTVRLVMSAQTIEGGAERQELAAAGVQPRIVDNPYIHAKMVLADGEHAFIGSQNFTSTSLDQNREVGIILTDVTNLHRLQRVFDDDFAAGLEEH